MQARVVLTSEAREDLRDLDGSAKKKVLKALKKLEQDPGQRGQPLGNQDTNLTTFRKLVVGDREFRIVFRIELDGTVVVIWVIGRRADRECYDLTTARLNTYNGDPEVVRQLKQLMADVWASTQP